MLTLSWPRRAVSEHFDYLAERIGDGPALCVFILFPPVAWGLFVYSFAGITWAFGIGVVVLVFLLTWLPGMLRP